MSNMYEGGKGLKTWNPFKGCFFQCSYCKPSFQAQAKRQKHNCKDCYNYEPHFHAERTDRVPNSKIIFACGNGDVAFAPPLCLNYLLHLAGEYTDRTFYFQSKRPECFQGLTIPDNVVLGTTLETDVDEGYRETVSKKAPTPSERYVQLLNLRHPRKYVTIEPIMKFSFPDVFALAIDILHPEFVYIGYNSRPKQVKLPEPDLADTYDLIDELKKAGIEVRTKLLRERIE